MVRYAVSGEGEQVPERAEEALYGEPQHEQRGEEAMLYGEPQHEEWEEEEILYGEPQHETDVSNGELYEVSSVPHALDKRPAE